MEMRRIVLDQPGWVGARVDAALAAGPLATDDARVALALDLARENARRGGAPFGALVVERATGRVVAAAANAVARHQSTSWHAELLAMAHATAALGRPALGGEDAPDGGYELVTSCAPCPLCLTAAILAGVSRVVQAARREDAQAAGFDDGPPFEEGVAALAARGIALVADVRREEGAGVLKGERR